jgi:hypothetical protein
VRSEKKVTYVEHLSDCVEEPAMGISSSFDELGFASTDAVRYIRDKQKSNFNLTHKFHL